MTSYITSLPGRLVFWALLLHAGISIPSALAQQQGCTLRKDKDGIKVFTCDSAGFSFKKIVASFDARVSVVEMAEFIMDVENYPDWQYNTTEASIVRRVGDAEVVHYTHVKAPWPIADRDMVVDQKVVQDAGTKIVTITAVSQPEFVPVKENLVRVPMSLAKWVLTPGNANVHVDYQIVLNPGGAVPPWMVNMVSAQAPYESFKNLLGKIAFRKPIRRFPFIVN